MPIFLDTTGQPTLGIGLCARCSRKFPLAELHPDPNSPGLMVCDEDTDQFDPYRLPARQSEQITLMFTRPDVPLTFNHLDTGLKFAIATEQPGIVILTENNRYIIVEGIAP